jgi:hypothetical protein
MADTMRLVSAYKVEQDLERTWREERELEEARAREKTGPYKPVDDNKKADGPYKAGVNKR